MKKVIYIPLDERPCNRLFPMMMAESQHTIEIVSPPIKLLSQKKRTADVEGLWDYVFRQIETSEALIMPLEMMGYGGLLPSRLHHRDNQQRKILIERMKRLKIIAPHLKIYMSALIMRTPQYNSSDEEPDYYEDYGYSLFRNAYLSDKKNRVGLSAKEDEEWNSIEIPEVYQRDYEERRQYNRETLLDILELVESQVIDFMVIPQDDSSEYGYTAIDQQQISEKIRELRLQTKVMMYPGADESGATLLGRCFNELMGQCPKIYPYFSSIYGPALIPKYEDRPMYESLQSHIYAAGCQEAESVREADFILAINCPGKIMEEAPMQGEKDISYTRHRHLLSFAYHIRQWLDMNKPVALADCAFINGGEVELVTLLDDLGILDRLISYKGWNTYCNTLGTSITQGIFAYHQPEVHSVTHHLIYHLLDDLFYQAIIRPQITATLKGKDLSYFDLKTQGALISKEIERQMQRYYQHFIKHSFKNVKITELKAYSPWNRMFEVGLELKIEVE